MFNEKSLTMGMGAIPNNDITYLEEIVGTPSDFKILPYDMLTHVPLEDMLNYCVKHALYVFPTKELIDFLELELKKDKTNTIEIGSGSGIICNALDITGTDSYMQTDKKVQMLYNLYQQTPITYGANVRRYSALDAIKLYKPRVVIAGFVTHIFNAMESFREGNVFGVDEEALLKKVKKYIFIGNAVTHKFKPILNKPHKEYKFDWLITRAFDQDLNRIWVWER